MTNDRYSIQIGREYIDNISGEELESLRDFISDFLDKEKDIPAAALTDSPESSLHRKIVICKDAFFDALTRKFETTFNIFAGEDSVTDLSGREILELYFTLRSFLAQSENCLKETDTPRRKEKTREISVGAYVPRKVLIGLREKSNALCKRTWLTDNGKVPQSDYTLSTPYGSAFRVSREDLSALHEKIVRFLNGDFHP